MNTCVIPARGGSKSLVRKNVLPVAGLPLLAWSIRAAQEAETVGQVVVTTDDTEIAEVAEQSGADVIWRPAELASDTATSESALLHALDELETAAQLPEYLIFMQCTSPLTTGADIDGTVQAMLDQQADTALAVTDFHYFVWRRDGEGNAVGVNHDKRVRQRRQDREPQYLETGAVYVMKTAGFREHKHRFFGKTAMYVMPPERVLEIDEPVDLAVAEARLRERLGGVTASGSLTKAMTEGSG